MSNEQVKPTENAVVHIHPKTKSSDLTLEVCMAEASKHKTKTQWKQTSFTSYHAAKKNGWLDQCTAHMVSVYETLTLEECMNEAKNYRTKMEWRKNGRGYHTACKKNWLEQCTAHMQSGHIKWTKELCLEEAKKYESLGKWYTNSQSSYRAAMRGGWMQEFAPLFKTIKKGRTKLFEPQVDNAPVDTGPDKDAA